MPLQFSPFRGNGHKPHTIYPMIVIPLLAIVLIAGTLTLFLENFAHASPPDTLVPLRDTIPPVLAHSKLAGPTNSNQTISLSISLHLRSEAALKNYLDDVTRPKSVNFHRYLTPAQFQTVFSPTTAAHNAVLNYLRNSGFAITHTYKHRMLIGFKGTVGLAEQVFHVSINNYTAPDGHMFFSNNNDPLLPASLVGSVISISGLNNALRYHHSSLQLHSSSTSGAKTNASAVTCPTTSASYFLPSQLATGYNLNGLYSAGYHGEGQTVALFELDSTNMNDISNYRACFDQGSNTSIQVIPVNGGPPAPGANDAGPAEVELDAQLVLSTAPKLGQLRLYEAANNPPDANFEWAQILQDAPPVVSTSWGLCEADLNAGEATTENTYFAAMAAQGQTVFAASGDSGSAGCYVFGSQAPNNTALSVDDPASQPFVTAVGGTSLKLNPPPTNTYLSEATWNNQPTNAGTNKPTGGASGGGFSTIWAKPNWQAAPGVKAGKRQVPDVSLNADPAQGYLFYCTEATSGCTSNLAGYPWLDIGGTSCGAPMWAALMALINQESVKKGGFNLGFINSLLYQIASGAHYAQDFHDITTGNNDFNALNGGKYGATAAYDTATGLGSFNAANLAADLIAATQSNQRAAPANTKWYFAEGSAGGGFQEYLTVQNPSSTQTANVSVQYLIQGGAPKTVPHTVNPSSRTQFDVDKDLNTTQTGPHYSVSAIVTSDIPVVVERPMYFNAVGVQSGTDVLGATNPGTSYYFSEADSTQSGQQNYTTFLTMLNPSPTATAHITITYFTGSCGAGGQPACPTEPITLQPLQRGTALPTDQNLHQKLAIKVTSDIAVVVERPLYFKDNIGNAGGAIAGAASEVGATATGTNWLFAEGYTGAGFQQYFELANFGTVDAHATIKLEYTNGDTQTIPVTVPALGHVPFDVNNANAHPGTCVPTACAVTTSVSAQITSDNPIVADRLMYFHFGPSHIAGGTDVVGTPAANNVYAFAEGYTNGAFSEFLTLQNPTGASEVVAVTFFTTNNVFQEQVTVPAHSRKTISVNSAINAIQSGAVSMTVQALGNNTTIVAERPQYFIYGTDQGGTNVIGYIGG